MARQHSTAGRRYRCTHGSRICLRICIFGDSKSIMIRIVRKATTTEWRQMVLCGAATSTEIQISFCVSQNYEKNYPKCYFMRKCECGEIRSGGMHAHAYVRRLRCHRFFVSTSFPRIGSLVCRNREIKRDFLANGQCVEPDEHNEKKKSQWNRILKSFKVHHMRDAINAYTTTRTNTFAIVSLLSNSHDACATDLIVAEQFLVGRSLFFFMIMCSCCFFPPLLAKCPHSHVCWTVITIKL